jgi:exonuclease III
MLIRRGVGFENPLLDPDGRLIAIDVGPVTLINIYAPSGARCKEERNEFFRKTVPAYAVASKLPLILMGDFNSVENLSDRSEVNKPCNPSKRTSPALVEMIQGLELVDMWLELEPDDPGHTFYHPQGSSRIDRAYFSREITNTCSNIKTIPASFSDHFCLHFQLSNTEMLPRRRTNRAGLWKLNTAVLNKEPYISTMTSFIKRSANHPFEEEECLRVVGEGF